MGICHTGNKHHIYMMPKVTSVSSEISSLLGIWRHVRLCLEVVARLWMMLMCESLAHFWRTALIEKLGRFNIILFSLNGNSKWLGQKMLPYLCLATESAFYFSKWVCWFKPFFLKARMNLYYITMILVRYHHQRALFFFYSSCFAVF